MSYFLLLVLTLFILVNSYLYWRISHLFNLSRNLPLILLVIFLSSSFLIDPLHAVGALWIGFLCLLFSLFVCLEIVSLFLFYLTGRTLWKYVPQRLFGSLCLLVTVAVSFYAWTNTQGEPELVTLRVTTPDWEASKSPYRFVLLTDAHLDRFVSKSEWQRVIHAVSRARPNVILLGGDFIDDTRPSTRALIQQFRDSFPNIPIYAVSGNHESYQEQKPKEEPFIKLAPTYGIELLRQEAKALSPTLYLAGIDDKEYRDINTSVAEVLQKVPLETTLLLLSHRPFISEDLILRHRTVILASHTHGGQLPPFHLTSWYFNDGLLSGLYDIGLSSIFVVNGARQWGPPMRLFAPAQIGVIELTHGDTFQVHDSSL